MPKPSVLPISTPKFAWAVPVDLGRRAVADVLAEGVDLDGVLVEPVGIDREAGHDRSSALRSGALARTMSSTGASKPSRSPSRASVSATASAVARR